MGIIPYLFFFVKVFFLIIYYSSVSWFYMYRRNKLWILSISRTTVSSTSLTTLWVVCQSTMMLWYCSKGCRSMGSICIRSSRTPRRRSTILLSSIWIPPLPSWTSRLRCMIRQDCIGRASSLSLSSPSLRDIRCPSAYRGDIGSSASRRENPNRHDPRKGRDKLPVLFFCLRIQSLYTHREYRGYINVLRKFLYCSIQEGYLSMLIVSCFSLTGNLVSLLEPY